MKNSSLVSYTKISPNSSNPRNKPITRLIIHHQAMVNASLQTVGNGFANPSRQASATYAVDSKGNVGQYVDEKNRPWTSSSAAYDNQAVTIEVANDGGAPDWHVSDKALQKTIELCADICKRNGIKELKYTGDLNGNLLRHNMLAATACLPLDRTELLTPQGWVSLRDVKVGDEVCSVIMGNMTTKFSKVLDVVRKKENTTFWGGIEASSDHNIMYYNELYRRVMPWRNVRSTYKHAGVFVPGSAFAADNVGMGLLKEKLLLVDFLVLVHCVGEIADGEIIFRDSAKIKKVLSVLNNLDFDYEMEGVPGNEDFVARMKITKYIAPWLKKYLPNNVLSWDWLDMSRKEVQHFQNNILDETNNSACRYTSKKADRQSADVVSAVISMLYGDCVHIGPPENPNNFVSWVVTCLPHKRLLGPEMDYWIIDNVETGCVTVESGFILIRQNDKTVVVGNCPGPYLQSKFPYIAQEVNKLLSPKPVEPAKPLITYFSDGDKAMVELIQWYTKYEAMPRKEYDVGHRKWSELLVIGGPAISGAVNLSGKDRYETAQNCMAWLGKFLGR